MITSHPNRYAVAQFIVKRRQLGRKRPARARDLLPSTDPQIASMIHRLQYEVRAERCGVSRLVDRTLAACRLNRAWPQTDA